MTKDNNPFSSPALRQPTADTMSTGDGSAFVDGVKPGTAHQPTEKQAAKQPIRLDQMNGTFESQPLDGFDQTTAMAANTNEEVRPAVAAAPTEAQPASDKTKKGAKKHMFGKKSKKQKQEEVFGGSTTINPSPAAVDTTAASAVNTGGAIDIDEALTQTTPAPSAAQPAAPTTPAKEKGQTKQLTISLMTIIFFILFVAATAAAVYFYIQNNKNKANYDDISAKYESLKSTNDNSATSSAKSKTQYDALQTKIKDLTKDKKELTKTVNDNKKTINDLNTKNATLTKQAADANKKLTADKTVSDQIKQLVITMCTSKEFSKSSACVNSSSSSSDSGNSNSNNNSNSGNRQTNNNNSSSGLTNASNNH